MNLCGARRSQILIRATNAVLCAVLSKLNSCFTNAKNAMVTSVAVNNAQKKPPEEGAKFFSRKNARKTVTVVVAVVGVVVAVEPCLP